MFIKLKMFISIIIFFSTLSLAFAETNKPQWNLTSRYVRSHSDHVIKSILEFQNGDTKLIYKPLSQPWGSGDNYQTVIDSKTYFITSWANGASIVYRVFEPAGHGENLLCEVHSFSESTSLKKTVHGFKILVRKERDSVSKEWVNCSPEEERRSSSSVKVKKRSKKLKVQKVNKKQD